MDIMMTKATKLLKYKIMVKKKKMENERKK